MKDQQNPPYTNQQLAQIFRNISTVLTIQEDKFFRIRSYQQAAETIENLTQSLSELSKTEIKKLPNIGAAIADKIHDLNTTGSSKSVNKILSQVPSGVFPLTTIPQVGPKTAYKLAKQLDLNNPDTAISKLKQAILQNKLTNIDGIGKKTLDQILAGIKQIKQLKTDRIQLNTAQNISQEIINDLLTLDHVQKISALGSLRRYKPTIGDIDIGIQTNFPSKIVSHLKNSDYVKTISESGNKLIRFSHKLGINVDIKIITGDKWGSLLQHFTGSKAHNILLREYAQKRNLSLSEYGIKRNNELQTYTSEQKFYQDLGLDYIPPELRQGDDEIKIAAKHDIPQLIKVSDIKGDLHTHTSYDWSSSHDLGQNTIMEMIDYAQNLNYQYIAIGDHNPSKSAYSQSEATQAIKSRSEQIDRTAQKFSIKVYKTLEVDIDKQGNLAIPESATKHLDFIIASIHSNFKLSQSTMTKRIISAIAHPKVKLIAHPTGRIIHKRPGYQLDWSKIFTACQKHNVALEINANPNRLDLPDQIIKQAIQQNIKLAINTDAHNTESFNKINYGVANARRGWATAKNIINTWSAQKLTTWLAKTS